MYVHKYLLSNIIYFMLSTDVLNFIHETCSLLFKSLYCFWHPLYDFWSVNMRIQWLIDFFNFWCSCSFKFTPKYLRNVPLCFVMSYDKYAIIFNIEEHLSTKQSLGLVLKPLCAYQQIITLG